MGDGESRKPSASGQAASEDYIRLGILLQRERDPTRKRLVEKVLRSPLDVGAKIARIDEIDRGGESAQTRTEAPSGVPAPFSKGRPAEAPALALSDEDATMIFSGGGLPEDLKAAREARKLQHSLRIPVRRAGFFLFVFREYPAIRTFARKTRLLTLRFPFRVLPNFALAGVCNEAFRKSGRSLFAALEAALDDGWIVLSKYEYNTLVFLHQFCKDLSNVEFGLVLSRGVQVPEPYRLVEQKLLVFHAMKDLGPSCASIIARLVDGDPARYGALRSAPALMKKLFEGQPGSPKLYDVCAALEMAKARRFISMAEMVRIPSGPLISSAEFDCSDAVRKKINQFVMDVKSRLVPAVAQRTEVFRVKALLPAMKDGRVEQAPIELFYDAGLKARSLGFQKDKGNFIILTQRLFDLYLASAGPFLNGAVQTAGLSKVRIFDGACFGQELDRIRFGVTKLEKFALSLGTFSIQRYLEFRAKARVPTGPEAEAMHVLAEMPGPAASIGLRLSQILALPERPAEKGADWSNAPLEAAVFMGKPRALPYAEQMIADEGLLHGLTIKEALRECASLSLSLGAFYGESGLLSMIESEERLSKEIKGMLQLLERMAPQRIFKYLQNKYRL